MSFIMTRRAALAAGALLVTTALAGPAAIAPAAAQSDPATLTVITRLTDTGFDPAFHFAEYDGMDVLNLYEPLVYPQKGAAPTGHLAESWVSPDAKVWTFKLRQNVKFHDGKPLTAKDVVYSMDRMLTINKGYSYLWAGILKPGATAALDDYTVRFTLERPFGPFLDTLVQFFVLNSELVKTNTAKEGPYGANGDFGTAFLKKADAGSGPYTLAEVVPDSRRAYKKFDAYWGGWKDKQFNRVVVQIVGEAATARELIAKGDVDFVDQWQPVEFYKNVAKEAKVTVPETPDMKLYFIQMNTQKPPLDDANFRRAIAHAFDYKTAIEQIMGGAVTGQGPIPSSMPGFDPSTPKAATDLAKAKEFLAKSKYKPDQYVLEYSYIKAGVHEPVSLLFQANMAQLGIKVEIKTEQWPVLSKNAAKPDTAPHFFPVYNTAKYPSPDAYTHGMYHPQSHGGWQAASHYSNDQVTKMIDEARATADTAKRNKLFADAAKIVVDDATALWVAYPFHRVAINKRVKNYQHIGVMAFDLRAYNLRYE